MFNPSYLIQSRHGIYYFRYPLPIKALNQGKRYRVSMSLETRCPHEALRLAQALTYHSEALARRVDWGSMNFAEINDLFKTYHREALERLKSEINENGPLARDRVSNIQAALEQLNDLIQGEYNDIEELCGISPDNPRDKIIHKDLEPIMKRFGLAFEPGSKPYEWLASGFKYARRNHFLDVLACNRDVRDYSLLDKEEVGSKKTKTTHTDRYLSGYTDSGLDRTQVYQIGE